MPATMTASSTFWVRVFHSNQSTESLRLRVTCYLLCPPEKFFQMKRSQCKDGLEIYKRFLTRMTRVSEFFKIAEVKSRPHPHTAAVRACPAEFKRLSFHSQQMGIDKNDIPELTQVRIMKRCRLITS